MPVRSSIRFGSVSGIEIGASWTWLIIVALVFASLGTAVFPATSPGLSAPVYFGMAAVAALVFFASLTAHELGHALQAQKEGMEIDGITLWVFGGVARFKGQFPSPGAEMRIALAGPAVSLVLGVAFLAVALALDLPPAVDGVLFWLGQINLILLAFNMLPALPLDGGRVLRAFLWGRRGDFGSATRASAALGRGFGQFMVAGGLLLALFLGTFSGVWLALMGLFLIGAAEAEARAAQTTNALEGLKVADVTVEHPVTVRADMPLGEFMDDVFLEHRHTAYPVLGSLGEPVGVVSFRTVAGRPRREWPHRTVADAMVPLDRALVVKRDAALQEAMDRLMEDQVRRGLVMDGDRFAGLISLTDAARVLEARRAAALD